MKKNDQPHNDLSSPVRLDIFVAQKYQKSRSYIKKVIDEGCVLVNSKRGTPSQLVNEADEIVADFPPARTLDLAPYATKLDILYEDSSIIVVNKPAGMIVHPGAGTRETTLVHALLHHCHDLSGIGGVERPGIVHRLDKDTSGVIIITKTDQAHQSISQQFKDRTVSKTYLALIEGTVSQCEGEIHYPIGRHPKHRNKMTAFKENPSHLKVRPATTLYKTITCSNNRTLLQLHPLTGRTHQIRVHLAAIGHPIIGDPLYGHKHGKNLLLHAYRISFLHPETHVKLELSAPAPLWAKPYI